MIRWLVAVLLLANVAVFMWIRWHAAPLESPDVPPERAEVAPEKMRLINEKGVRLVARAQPPPATTVPAVAAKTCARLGPFAGEEEAARAASILGEKEIRFERQKEERRSVTGYRVILPPFPSRQAAEAKRQELNRLGFRDHALIQEEGKTHALSLGLYAIEANAQRHLRRLSEKGVEARLQPLHQTRTVYWLELRLDEPPLAGLRREKWGGGAAILIEACPSLPPAPTPEKPPSGTQAPATDAVEAPSPIP
jgi:hypothetical protein